MPLHYGVFNWPPSDEIGWNGELPQGVRLVHNFCPGPSDDPGRDRQHQSSRLFGPDGFRYWVTDEPNPNEHRCFCGWHCGVKHYGTRGYVDERGVCWRNGRHVMT
jgi:hypothetical protein